MKPYDNVEKDAPDKDTLVDDTDRSAEAKEKARRKRRNALRRERDAVLRSLGLTKVRGLLGGIYWE